MKGERWTLPGEAGPAVEPRAWSAERGTIARPYRVLAWPDYASAGELRHLCRTFGGLVAASSDVALCLMHVPGMDPRADDASQAFRGAWEDVVGTTPPEGVRFVEGSPTPDAWPDLGVEAHGVLGLPSAHSGQRRTFVRLVDCPVIEQETDLRLLLSGLRGRRRDLGWRLPLAPVRHGLAEDHLADGASWSPASIWSGLGFDRSDLSGRIIVEIGCGPRLRTTWFEGARIEVVEPRADALSEHIPWTNLRRADAIHRGALEAPVASLEGQARLVVLESGVEGRADGASVMAAAASYLASDGQLVVRGRDVEEPAALTCVGRWSPRGADHRAAFSVWRLSES